MQLTDWLCPGCRDVCTCSAENCKRTLRKWLPTGQLSGEAGQQGYMSVSRQGAAHLAAATGFHVVPQCAWQQTGRNVDTWKGGTL